MSHNVGPLGCRKPRGIDGYASSLVHFRSRRSPDLKIRLHLRGKCRNVWVYHLTQERIKTQGRGRGEGSRFWKFLTTEFWKSEISKFQIRPYSKRTCVRCPWPLPRPATIARGAACTRGASPRPRRCMRALSHWQCTVQGDNSEGISTR